MIASRRSFITGFVALVAAPAIVRAGSIMPVNSGLVPMASWELDHDKQGRAYFSRVLEEYDHDYAHARVDVLYGSKQIRPEWDNSPGFIARVNAAYDEQFPNDNARVGDVLRIRLPNDWIVMSDPRTQLLSLYEPKVAPKIPDSLALAAAAVAVAPAVLAKPVTRRFWGK